jgi:hypothetical protein
MAVFERKMFCVEGDSWGKSDLQDEDSDLGRKMRGHVISVPRSRIVLGGARLTKNHPATRTTLSPLHFDRIHEALSLSFWTNKNYFYM